MNSGVSTVNAKLDGFFLLLKLSILSFRCSLTALVCMFFLQVLLEQQPFQALLLI